MHFKAYKSILSPKNGVNLYRGCLHGCIYCDSRSSCYQMDHAFEDIEVKTDALNILNMQLKNKQHKCMISTGAMTDPYIPLERQLKLTRGAMELAYKYDFGMCVLTKSDDILNDLDIIKKINDKTKFVVEMTLTTYDNHLSKILEPNVCTSQRRIEVLEIMQQHNIPTVVWLGPFLPFINDDIDNLAKLLNECVRVGVKGIVMFEMGVTMRNGNREYFYQQLDKYFPGIKEKYIQTFGDNYGCRCSNHQQLKQLFYDVCRQNNIICEIDQVFAYLNQYETKDVQLKLF